MIDIIDKITNLSYYANAEEIMRDIDLLNHIGHVSSENRLENSSIVICNDVRQLVTRIVQANNGIAMMGRYGPGTTIVVGVKIDKMLAEEGIVGRLGDMEIIVTDEIDENDVLCCRYFGEGAPRLRGMFPPYFQFFGFTVKK